MTRLTEAQLAHLSVTAYRGIDTSAHFLRPLPVLQRPHRGVATWTVAASSKRPLQSRCHDGLFQQSSHPWSRITTGDTIEEVSMGRSRSFNRFHRYLARQKRRGLRSVLPQFQMDFESYGPPIDHSRDMLNRLKGREVELELLDAEA